MQDEFYPIGPLILLEITGTSGGFGIDFPCTDFSWLKLELEFCPEVSETK